MRVEECVIQTDRLLIVLLCSIRLVIDAGDVSKQAIELALIGFDFDGAVSEGFGS